MYKFIFLAGSIYQDRLGLRVLDHWCHVFILWLSICTSLLKQHLYSNLVKYLLYSCQPCQMTILFILFIKNSVYANLAIGLKLLFFVFMCFTIGVMSCGHAQILSSRSLSILSCEQKQIGRKKYFSYGSLRVLFFKIEFSCFFLVFVPCQVAVIQSSTPHILQTKERFKGIRGRRPHAIRRRPTRGTRTRSSPLSQRRSRPRRQSLLHPAQNPHNSARPLTLDSIRDQILVREHQGCECGSLEFPVPGDRESSVREPRRGMAWTRMAGQGIVGSEDQFA